MILELELELVQVPEKRKRLLIKQYTEIIEKELTEGKVYTCWMTQIRL